MIWHDRPWAALREIDPEAELELRLSAQARAGAAWALSALVARYQPPVVRYLVRLTGSQQTAYALAEQVFVRMGRRLRGPQGGRQLRLWLLRAATEAGLDAIRRPATNSRGRLAAAAGPVGLLPAVTAEPRVSRILTSLGIKTPARDAEHDVPRTPEFVWQLEPEAEAQDSDANQPPGGVTSEQVRQRLIRAVLAELPYGDAQCLALHLVAHLNQSEVAQSLGVADVIVRRRIVQGLQVFARRYEATLERLGLREDVPNPDASAVVDAPRTVPVASTMPDASGEAGEAPAGDLSELAGEAPMLVDELHPARVAAPLDAETREPPAGGHALVVVEEKPSEARVEESEAPATNDVEPVDVAADEPHDSEPEEIMADIADQEAAALPVAEGDAGNAGDAAAPEDVVIARHVDADVDAAWDDASPPTQREQKVAPGRILAVQPVVPEEVAAGTAEPAEAQIETETAALAEETSEHEAASDATPKEVKVFGPLFPTAAPPTQPLSSIAAPEHKLGAAQETTAASGHDATRVVPARATRHRRSTRIRRVLSADGEAEDPGDEALWPLG
jgi:RNA polymerase sigma factor (sigma-70 family)